MSDSPHSFIAVTSEGGLLPSDFLQELLNPKSEVKGLDPKSYDLSEDERINEQVNRSWNRLKGCWDNFKKAIADKEAYGGLGVREYGSDDLQPPHAHTPTPPHSPLSTTTETRERWLLPLFQELGFGRLKAAKPLEIDGKSYGISHGIQLGGDGKSSGVYVPLHLVGSHVDLDRRTPGAVGAAKASPHSVTQQVLNAREDILWGIVSNGYILRLLRDNVALTRLSRLDFDLQQIFDGDLYSEFYLLWLVTHRSRFEAERPEQCILEQWKKTAEDKGLRALDNLRRGVEKAIVALGAGLVGHKKNEVLREKLRTGALTPQALYQQVLRVIYRLLFLLVTEGRDLLHPREDSEANRKGRKRYRDFYSITRLRGMTLYRAGTPHPDLWQVLQLVSRKVGSDKGCPELAMPALGSFLWTVDTSTPDLKDCLVSNRQVLEAIHALVFVQDGDIRRTVDYKNLGAEELGSVYESLLELHPQINPDVGTFDLKTAAGHERKTTGSYYTPDSLVQCLLDSALEPVVAEAITGKDGAAAEKAILALKVCDPACGSGHFAIAAAYRLARRLASIRSGGDEPSPEVYRTALRDVISHCIYAVDLNPMAVELCRINLWLESMVPGKPLSFLDHHIRVGNSLLGTTPELVAAGLPDAAFDAIEGDDKKACAALRKRNRGEREGIGGLFVKEDQFNAAALQQAASALDELPDERPEDIARKEQAFQQNEHAYDFLARKRIFDTWCAGFVVRRIFKEGGTEPIGITQRHLTDLSQGRGLPTDLGAQVDQVTRQYAFLHWALVFPEVFAKGGFDCALGNPPWERVKLQEREWFAERSPEIANAPNAATRKRLIEVLKAENPVLHHSFLADSRNAEGESHFMRNSGRYPLCGRGDINLYAVFAETMRNLLNERGRTGCVLPTGVATDDTTKTFFQDLIGAQSLVSLFDFENKRLIFPAVAPVVKFCLFTSGRGPRPTAKEAAFIFFAHAVEDLRDAVRRFTLSTEEIALLNPNTRTCPIFRSCQDAELTKAIYRRVPVLIREAGDRGTEENPWGIYFNRMFDMSNDSRLFRSREQLESGGWQRDGNTFRKDDAECLPLYEAKLLHQFNHRPSTFDGIAESDRFQMKAPTIASSSSDLANPRYAILPRFWVERCEVERACSSFPSARWFLAFRGMTNVMTNSRNAVFATLPLVAVGNSAPVCVFRQPYLAFGFLAAVNSFVLDYATRQKLAGGNMNFFILNQLPVPPPSALGTRCNWGSGVETLRDWVLPRVLELTYTAWDLEPFAKDCGYDGPPFRWDDERRFWLRAELDAAFFHLYLGTPEEWAKEPAALRDSFPTPRDAVSYIMDTFPIVRRKDEEKHGSYRTKNAILDIYDAMAVAARTGVAYTTRLDPIPASIRVAHVFDWESAPLKVPDEPRAAFHVAANYAPTVMLEMVWQNNGVIEWELLKRAWDLLCESDDLARKAHAEFGVVVAKWRKRYCDRLDRNDLVDTLSGFCHDGTMRMRQSDGERVVELCKEGRYAYFADVRSDARLALAVAATLPEEREAREDARLAELMALGSR